MDKMSYDQGSNDRKYAKIKNGEIVKKNPFNVGSGAYQSWENGWDDMDIKMSPVSE